MEENQEVQNVTHVTVPEDKCMGGTGEIAKAWQSQISLECHAKKSRHSPDGDKMILTYFKSGNNMIKLPF